MRYEVTSGPSRTMQQVARVLAKEDTGLKASGFARWRREVENRPYPLPTAPPRHITTRFHVTEDRVDGHLVYTVAPSECKTPVHLIYLHGGGYVAPLGSAHWVILQKLIEATGAAVTVPIYPLAPEHHYREAFAFLDQVCSRIFDQHPHGRVVFAGDSAGGGLALAQALRRRDLGQRLPESILLFAPWVDITMSNPEAAALEPVDVMLGMPGLVQAGIWWAGGDDPRSPLLSPLFGDLSGLPPVYIFQGTSDMLLPDVRRLHDAIADAGGAVQLFEYQGAFHVFVAASMTPEARDAFQRVAALLGTDS